MPGFISSSSDGINTTLGRGGSDYTAAIMAGALDATDLEIGLMSMVYTANPKIVKQAYCIYILSGSDGLSHLELKYCSLPLFSPSKKKYSYSYQEYFRTRSGRHVYFKHFYF
jgi:aspartokinase/homoserine dehydrogenase 1